MIPHDLILVACTAIVAFIAGAYYQDRRIDRPGVTSLRYRDTRKAWVMLADGTEAGAISDPDLDGHICVVFSNTVNKVCVARPMTPAEAEDFAEAIMTVVDREGVTK